MGCIRLTSGPSRKEIDVHPGVNLNDPLMLITIGICTFNRAESLRGTLDSLAAMRVPSDLAWEIVIVNNNCTDHTDDLISQYIRRLPLRRWLYTRAWKAT